MGKVPQVTVGFATNILYNFKDDLGSPILRTPQYVTIYYDVYTGLINPGHFGEDFFFNFWRLEMKQIDQKLSWEVDEETSGNAMLM